MQLQLAKIEQCATGAVYCAVMDSLYPGTFPFSRVKWSAKSEYEYVENYKVLQAAFDKNGIKRHIDVAKLVKARPLDNLEFCQWIKAYFDKNYNGDEYNALGRRKNQQLHYILGGGKVGGPTAAQPRPAASSGSNTGPRQTSGASAAASSTGASRVGAAAGGVPRAGAAAASGAAAGKVRELEGTVQELRLQNDTLDKERDFYFTKLRDIEMLLQGRPMEAGPGNDLSQDILKILYAAEDERVEVSASGELTITAPNGEQVSGEIPAATDAAAEAEPAADADAIME